MERREAATPSTPAAVAVVAIPPTGRVEIPVDAVPTETAMFVDDLTALDDLALERFEFMYPSHRDEPAVLVAEAD